jgi:putative DNA primase/helicase
MDKINLCSGHGAKDTNPLTIEWLDVQRLVDKPTELPKDRAQWLIPSSYLSRSHKEQEQYGKYWLCAFDFDEHPPPVPELAKITREILEKAFFDGSNFELYNTNSATEYNPKSRLLIPLEAPLDFEEWHLLQQVIATRFEQRGVIADRSLERAGQLSFLPNGKVGDNVTDKDGNTIGKRIYNKESERSCWLLDAELFRNEMNALADELQRQEDELKTEKAKALAARSMLKKPASNDSKNLIKAFNECYDVASLLTANGYEQRGNTFRHPNSKSGKYKASILNGRVHTFSQSDPLNSNGNGAHDAFSVFTVLEHGGDINAALKNAGNNFLTIDGVAWNKVVQREYMQNKEQEEVMNGFTFTEKDPQILKELEMTDEELSEWIANETPPTIPKLNEKIKNAKFPHVDDKEKAKSTIENLEYLLKVYGITLEYDEILKRRSIVFDGHSTKGHDMEDESSMMIIKSLCSLNGLSTTTIELLPAIFQKNTVNPIKNWIQSKEWDGIDRKQQLFETLTVAYEDEKYRDEVLNVWLTQCVAAADNGERGRALNPRAVRKFEIVLILQGKQGARKTSWIGSLLPDSLRDYVKDGMHLDPTDKDTTKKCISTWLCELGEIDATFRKADIARLKAFLSNQVDEMRLPYDRTSMTFKRRTSFCASVNGEQFLTDSTGSRRFIPIQVSNCNHSHYLDMQQIFAQFWNDYINGAIWWTTANLDDEVKARNEKHNEVSVIAEMVAEHFNVNDVDIEGTTHLTPTKILMESGIREPKRQQVKELTEFLQSKGFRYKAVRGIRGFSIAKLTTYSRDF